MGWLPGRRRRPTFLLGLGAQKAGTTWLWRYLAGSPEFVAGYRKEYHVWPSRDLELVGWRRRQVLGMAADQLAKAQQGEPADGELIHRASMVVDPDVYFDYFAGLLHGRPEARLTADLTVENGLLSAERLAEIKRAFAARGVRTAGVLLMRDPVERIWSQLRMEQRRRPERFPATADAMVAELHARAPYAMRTRYDRMLRAADQAFDRDELYVGLYEELFDEAQVRAICRVLGIGFRTPELGRRVNASAPKQVEALPDDVVRTVATRLADTYRAVAERLPDKDLTALWPSARHVL